MLISCGREGGELYEQSSSYNEKTVRHQFDQKCKLALEGEVVDYDRHMDYRRKHEVLFSELSECQAGELSVLDEYNETSYFFKHVSMM
mgnify:CR=1 FL=1